MAGCKTTPREVIERFAAEVAEDLAREEEARRAEAAARNPKPAPRTAPTRTRARSTEDARVKRCRAYVAKLPPSAEGAEGSKAIIKAARVIWNDFGLDEPEGYPLLQEYNQRAQPPWDEEGKDGLRRKWNEAVKMGTDSRGRGWLVQQEEERPRAAKGVRTAAPPGGSSDSDPTCGSGGLPVIVTNGRQFREVEAEALAALVAANDPPRLFVGNGCGLVQLGRGDPDSPLSALELTTGSARSALSAAADFVEVRASGEEVPDFPPATLIGSVLERAGWDGLPFLRSVVTYPVFAGADFQLHAASGYYPHSYLYLDLGALEVPEVPTVPSAEQVAAARELILDELLGDFPFIDRASRANAVAALILPTVRHAIAGPTPLAVFDAPVAGTGKSLLAEVVFGVTLGEEPSAQSPDLPDEEWNKMLLAELTSGSPVVYLDNANRKVDSGALASALTAKYKRGRVLGETRMLRALINVCWVLTANNFDCSQEIARRVYWCRIDRKMQDPAAANISYRHADLNEWVRANRPRLLAAVITLVNNWLATGKKPGTARLGKFERWAAVIGGILDAAGIDGFLENADELRRASNSLAGEMTTFLSKWYDQHAGSKVIVADVFALSEGILESVLSNKEERVRRTQLGKLIRANRDKVFGDFRIKECVRDGKPETDHSGRARYQLELVGGGKPKAAAADDEYQEGDGEFEVTA